MSLQARMKADGAVPPAGAQRDRVSIQRWSAQRLTLTAAAVLGTLMLVALVLDSLRAGRI